MKACATGQLLRCPRGLQFGNALDDFLCHRLPIRSRKGYLALIKILLSTVPEGYFHNTVLRIIAQVFFTNKVNYLPCKITLFLGTFGGYPLIKLKQKLQALGFKSNVRRLNLRRYLFFVRACNAIRVLRRQFIFPCSYNLLQP